MTGAPLLGLCAAAVCLGACAPDDGAGAVTGRWHGRHTDRTIQGDTVVLAEWTLDLAEMAGVVTGTGLSLEFLGNGTASRAWNIDGRRAGNAVLLDLACRCADPEALGFAGTHDVDGEMLGHFVAAGEAGPDLVFRRMARQ